MSNDFNIRKVQRQRLAIIAPDNYKTDMPGWKDTLSDEFKIRSDRAD